MRLQQMAAASKTNVKLQLLHRCSGNLHNNYNMARTVREGGQQTKLLPAE